VVIGLCHLELLLDGNFSLKGKRQVIKSLVTAPGRGSTSPSRGGGSGSVAKGGAGDLHRIQ